MTANLTTRRKELPQFKKRQYNSMKRKDWVSSSLTGRMTFLVELSATLNTLNAFMASLLKCRGKLIFQMMLGAIRSVIDTRETLKIRLKKMNSIFETKFRSYMQSLTLERPLELQQITQNLSPPPHLSSIGSTAAVLMWYPVDDITGDTPCRLYNPIGRVGNKTKEVAIGVAMSGHVFHNNLIPAEYAKVLVHEITGMACINYPLDHVTPQGIKELGEVVNQFILWNRHKIVLDGPTTPQNQLMSLLSQTATPKDNEVSTGSKIQGSFASVVSKGKGCFYVINVTSQGYAPVGPRPPEIRSTTVISLQHNPPGIRHIQPKYSFRPNEQVL
jgi:hypothetical protein